MLAASEPWRASPTGVECMSVGPVTSFVIENKVAADEYLVALFENPDFKSMDEVERRAASYITDPRVKQYFIGRAKACLATEFEEITFTDADLNIAKRKAFDWIKKTKATCFL